MGKSYLTILTFLSFLSFSTASSTLNYGDDLTAWFNTLGESHTYTFDATAGDIILLRMRGTSGGVDACMELFDPSGISIGLACDDGGIVFFDGMELATTGTYTLETHDHDNNDTGDYGLSLTLLNNPAISEPIICTTDLMGNFEHQTQVDVYAYTGNAGDLMVVQMRAVQGNIESQLRLYDPSGNLLAEALPDGGLSRIDAFILPETGTYTVLCMDKNGNDTGDYGFSIQWINTSNCAVPLECGVGQTAMLDYIVQMHAYSIDINSGDRVYVRMRGDLGIEAELQLYDPNGALVASDAPSVGMATIENYQATISGTYFVMARDGKGNDTGYYGIIYRNLSDETCTVPLDCDEDFSASLSQLADLDIYRFEGVAGEKFWVQARCPEASLEEQIEWYDAAGNQLAIDISAGGMVSLEEIELPADGEYFIFFCDKSGNDTGDYGFGFQQLTNANCATSFACDENTFTGTLDELATIQTYSLSGLAGDIVSIDMVEEEGSEELEPLLCVCAPDGSIIIDETASHDIHVTDFELPQNGDYLLLAMDRHGNDLGNYTITVTGGIASTDNAPIPTIAVLPDLEGACEVVLEVPTATDACSGDVINGTTDDPMVYEEAGSYIAEWTYTDENGNTTVQLQAILIENMTAAPIPTAENLPMATGACFVELDLPTAVDACSGEVIYGEADGPTFFDEQGFYTVTWYYVDGNENMTMQMQEVLVENSSLGPIPTEETLVAVTGTCFVELSFPTAVDACNGEMIYGEPNGPTTFDLPGVYTVTWYYVDQNGNTITQEQIVTVDGSDPIPTVADLPVLTADCSIEIEAPTATDACTGNVIFGHTTNAMFYDEQGVYTIVWIYEDAYGNATTQTQTVVVEDTTPPLTFCEDITLTLDETGYILIDEVTLAGDSYDECGLYLFNSEVYEFTCDNIGLNPVYFSVKDVNGNVSTCELTITIEGSDACSADFVCGDDLPEGCTQASIGNNEGDACYDEPNDMYEISAVGGDIYGTSDKAYYVYANLNGFYYVKAKLTEMTGTESYALAGLMMRKQVNNAGSRNAGLFVTPDGSLLLQVRSKNNDYTYVEDLGQVSLPIWLKLEYENKKVLAYTSENGSSWDQVGAASVNLNGNFYAGMAVSGYNDNEENVAYFQYALAGQVSNFTGASNLQSSTTIMAETCKDEVENREDSGNCNTKGKKSKKKVKKIDCYPNPAMNDVNVDLKDFENQKVDVMLMNLTGQVVWSTTKEVAPGEQLNVDLLSLPLEQGYYRMSVRSGKKITSKPVFIMRPED